MYAPYFFWRSDCHALNRGQLFTTIWAFLLRKLGLTVKSHSRNLGKSSGIGGAPMLRSAFDALSNIPQLPTLTGSTPSATHNPCFTALWSIGNGEGGAVELGGRGLARVFSN